MNSKFKKIDQIVKREKFENYRYEQIINAIFKQRINKYDEMVVLPQKLREALTNELGNSVSSVQPIAETEDKQANKVLFGLPDGNQIEAMAKYYTSCRFRIHRNLDW